MVAEYKKVRALLLEELKKIPRGTKVRILEIGGQPLYLRNIKQVLDKEHDVEVVGVSLEKIPDVEKQLLKKDGIRYIQGDAAKPKTLADAGKFDFIVSSNVLSDLAMLGSYVPVDMAFSFGRIGKLGELKNAAREKGRVVIQKIHENSFARLKPGGKAIHVTHPTEPVIPPKGVLFEVKERSHSRLILKKPHKVV